MSENHTGDDHTSGRPRVRASDVERERVAAVLRQAMGEGRLTLDEGEQRLAAAYATTYRDELPAFTADLPAAGPGLAAAQPAPGGAPPRVDQPRRRSGDRLIGLVAVAAVVVGAVALAGGRTLWPAIVLGILAVMLVKRRAYGRWHAAGHHGRHPVDRPWHQRAER